MRRLLVVVALVFVVVSLSACGASQEDAYLGSYNGWRDSLAQISVVESSSSGLEEARSDAEALRDLYEEVSAVQPPSRYASLHAAFLTYIRNFAEATEAWASRDPESVLETTGRLTLEAKNAWLSEEEAFLSGSK